MATLIEFTARAIAIVAVLHLGVATPALAKSYKGAITAKELLVLLGACNLEDSDLSSREQKATLAQMCEQGLMLLKLGIEFDSEVNEWTWQPGVMRDHPDFIYAGNQNVAPKLNPAPVPGISLDSSHFYSKWPLFLVSAQESRPSNEFLQRARMGLVENLFKRVVDGKPESGQCVIRYRTFTDGTNGVFRWNYRNRGSKYGEGAYQQSAAPFYSSLAVLDDPRISNHYEDIFACYPYPRSIRATYFGHRNPQVFKLLVDLSRVSPTIVKSKGLRLTAEQQYLYRTYFKSHLHAAPKAVAKEAYSSVVGPRILVMHYAFWGRIDEWIEDYFRYAATASDSLCASCADFDSLYSEVHLVFFLTRFLRVALQNGYASHPHFESIRKRTETRVLDLYVNRQREVVSNAGWDDVRLYGFRDYVNWKLGFYKNLDSKPH